jgi:hypothetical protein
MNRAIACKYVRILRWSSLLSLLLAVPVVVPAGVLIYHLTGSYDFAFLAGGFWMGLYSTVTVALGLIRCPSCGRRFTRHNVLWPVRCARCGFRC